MRVSSFLTATSLSTALFFGSAVAQRTTEQQEAQITNATEECTPYYYAPSADQRYNFPTIWEPASILSNDTEAQAKYQSIQSAIPNIPPKGTQPQSLEGNFTGYSYPASDPDCWWTFDKCTTPKLSSLPPDMTGAPEPDTLGFGFDDGPNCSHNAFYDYLEANNQKATMFYIGSNVMDWPLEAQRGLADGHEICVHTWSHRYTTSLTNEQVFAEFYYTMKAIKLVVGVTPTCWRPPFGDMDDRVRAIAHALGLRTIVWQYDSNDWQVAAGDATVQQVNQNYQNLINSAKNGTFANTGTIMLTHELNNFTMSEMMTYYDQLKSAFKHLVPMLVSLNQTQPYVETNYSLPTFEQYISGTLTTSGPPPNPSNLPGLAPATTLGASGSASTGAPGSSGSKNGAMGGMSSNMGAWAATAVLMGSVARMML